MHGISIKEREIFSMYNEKEINVGIIGGGERGMIYLRLSLSGIREGVHVKALADPDVDKMKSLAGTFYKEANTEPPRFYGDYREMLDHEDINAVFISSSDTTHKEIFLDVVSRGKHILLEKPLATTIEDCFEIYKASVGYSKVIKLGFVLRYTGFYKKIKEIIEKGDLGKIISIEAREILGVPHAGSYFRRWHRFKKNNGGFVNAKCSHDIDLLNWMVDSEPAYVSAFGSRIFFNKKDGAAQECKNCDLKHECKYLAVELPPDAPDYYWHTQKDYCVFNSEKDIVDHEILTIEYANGVTAAFIANMFGDRDRRSMTINGSEAELKADLTEGTIQITNIYPKYTQTYKIEKGTGGHSGGDEGLFKCFIDAIQKDDVTDGANEVKRGLLSSLVAMSGETSMEEKRVIDVREYYVL